MDELGLDIRFMVSEPIGSMSLGFLHLHASG